MLSFFLCSSPQHLFPSFFLYCLLPTMLFVCTLIIKEAICLKLENSRYCPCPGFGENAPGEGLSGQESPPRRGSEFYPRTRSQAPGSKEESRPRAKTPPPARAIPDSPFAEGKAQPRALRKRLQEGGRARASPGTLPLTGFMLCHLSG